MSYFGSREQARKDCADADIQIDGNSPANTSPVRSGSDTAGMAPMEGEKMFSKTRTRSTFKGNQSGMRREFPTEGVSSAGK
jgi:hypothetical protein